MHRWAQSAMDRWINTKGINRYYQSILLVSFSSMLSIHRLKFFYFWLIVSTIDHKSLLWPMAIDPSVHTELIVSINRSNCSNNLPNFLLFFAMAMKKRELLLKNYFNFNRIIDTDRIDRYYRSCLTLKVSIHRLKILEVWPKVSIIGEKKLFFYRLYRSIDLIFFSSDDHRSNQCFLLLIDYLYQFNQCFFLPSVPNYD
jgi:hypothetical protein